jgi:hypothetical protein
MHPTQKPPDSERNTDCRIGLGFDDIAQGSLEGIRSSASRCASGVGHVRCLPSGFAHRLFKTLFSAS